MDSVLHVSVSEQRKELEHFSLNFFGHKSSYQWSGAFALSIFCGLKSTVFDLRKGTVYLPACLKKRSSFLSELL